MKKLLCTSLMLSILFWCVAMASIQTDDSWNENQPVSQTGQTIQIITSPGLAEITNQWGSAFMHINPTIQISVTELSDEINLSDEMLLVTDQFQTEQNTWNMVVAHSAIVTIVNIENPFLKEISQRGAVAGDFNQFLAENEDNRLKCYILDDQQLVASVASFSMLGVNEITAQKISAPAKLVAAVQTDKHAIGFCRLTDLIQNGNNSFPAQINILPIDRNKNGMLDSYEKFYDKPDRFTRGVWLGKYPRELCNCIYLSAIATPTEQGVFDFLTWINNEGQQYLSQAGYYPISRWEKTSNLMAFEMTNQQVQEAENEATGTLWRWGLVIALLVTALFVIIYRQKRQSTMVVHSEDIVMAPALNENSIVAPAGLYYGRTHTWAFMEKDGLVKIGIDDFLQHVTGPVTQLKMKLPGELIRKDEHILTLVRDGKQLEISSPVSGVIRENNSLLLSKPFQVNNAPYGLGWVYSVEPTNWYREIRFLFTANRYREWLEDEFIRLKDFLADSANANKVILQDGGELADNFLGQMSPIVWEDFQKAFLSR
ncbi:hypothetical protein [Mangrovibacterium sp.]|uniref:hypothetical protein n=1 Tax=Mangrovibacterium sp. TaxID=1961364 RepID=UPI0035648F45